MLFHSKPNPQLPGNQTIVVYDEGLATQFEYTSNPAARLRQQQACLGRELTATGTVGTYRGKEQLLVEGTTEVTIK